MGASLVCCVDFSISSDKVIDEARRLSRALDADVVLVHALPLEEPLTSGGVAPPGTHKVPAWDSDERKRRLEAEVARLVGAGFRATGKLILDERPAEAVHREVEARNASHLIIGSHGHAMVFELLVGSFTNAILRLSKVPVVVVPVARTET